MRFVTPLILLVIAGLALPTIVASGCFNLAVSDAEPGGYSLFEQIEFEEELITYNGGGWIPGLIASKAAWMQFCQRSKSLHPVPPPPKLA
jgi:hypothetical protein